MVQRRKKQIIIVDEYFLNTKKTRELAHIVKNLIQEDKTNIVLKFEDIALNKKVFLFFLKQLKVSYEVFTDKVKILGYDEYSVVDMIYDALHDKSHTYKNVFIGTLILSISFTLLFFNFDRLTDYYFYEKREIRNKIYYCIDKHKNRKELERYYHKRGTSLYWTVEKLSKEILINSKKFKLNPDMVISIIEHESDWHKWAASSVGAVGYMQIYIPVWGHMITNLSKIYEEDVNIEVGCGILSDYLKKNNGNRFKALVNYNGGRLTKTDSIAQINKVTFDYINHIIDTMDELGYYRTVALTNK